MDNNINAAVNQESNIQDWLVDAQRKYRIQWLLILTLVPVFLMTSSIAQILFQSNQNVFQFPLLNLFGSLFMCLFLVCFLGLI